MLSSESCCIAAYSRDDSLCSVYSSCPHALKYGSPHVFMCMTADSHSTDKSHNGGIPGRKSHHLGVQ